MLSGHLSKILADWKTTAEGHLKDNDAYPWTNPTQNNDSYLLTSTRVGIIFWREDQVSIFHVPIKHLDTPIFNVPLGP